MVIERITDRICTRCLELIEDCMCDEEPRVVEWEDHPFQPAIKIRTHTDGTEAGKS